MCYKYKRIFVSLSMIWTVFGFPLSNFVPRLNYLTLRICVTFLLNMLPISLHLEIPFLYCCPLICLNHLSNYLWWRTNFKNWCLQNINVIWKNGVKKITKCKLSFLTKLIYIKLLYQISMTVSKSLLLISLLSCPRLAIIQSVNHSWIISGINHSRPQKFQCLLNQMQTYTIVL